MKPRTLLDKIWDAHEVEQTPDGSSILYIDRHYLHEVTTPQAFAGLKARGLPVLRPERAVATADHNVPTVNQHLPVQNPESFNQLNQLIANTREHGIRYFGLGHPFNGIVHVIGPELGLTLPGMTIVCGDSHTSTHGAFGAVAFGIGTSEVEMVLASQCIIQSRPKTFRITVNGSLKPGVTAKDLALFLISKLGTDGGSGFFVEFAGSTIRQLSMEGRMTLCNMSIEMGARGGLVAPDGTTLNYLKGREFAPEGKEWQKAVDRWSRMKSDPDARFDREEEFNAAEAAPMITWGTNPGAAIPVDGIIPDMDPKALKYMDFAPGEPMIGKKVDYVFLGSCTNGRIEDLRLFAGLVKGRKKAPGVTVWVVPGSKQVEKQAVEEGIDRVLQEAGMALRQPGCSACLAMNEDKIPTGKYCVSTSNRNFEGRQGPGSRTLLASPLTAAAAAVTGVITDFRTIDIR